MAATESAVPGLPGPTPLPLRVRQPRPRRPRRLRRLPWLVLAVGAGVLVAVPGLAAQEGLTPGAAVEPVVIETLEGEPADLGEIVGTRPVLVEFWATWCAVCRALEPRVAEAHARYGDEVEFLVVAVAVSQTQAQIRRHMDRHPVTGRVLWDTQGRAARAFDAPGTGYVVVLDAGGRVSYAGTGGDQDLVAAVASALER